jgi:hypothetical protein
MKREIKVIKNGLLQVTFLKERWYAKEQEGGEYIFYPSVTWISSYYPKGIAFYRWLANTGWDEAEAIKSSAGDRGNTVHQSAMDFDNGVEIKHDSKYLNNTSGQMEELSLEEYECILSYDKWHKKVNPQILANEMTVFNYEDNYAGTIDKIAKIGDRVWIIDLKTSQDIWEEHKLQLSAYSHSKIDYKSLGITDKEWEKRGLAVIQVGYRRNKDKFKFTEVEDKFPVFLATKVIWENENSDSHPFQKDYPLSVKIGG